MKKKGFGTGNFNGIGGKVEAGEDVKAAALRELSEEVSVNVNHEDALHKATLDFFYSDKPEWNQQVHVFVAHQWEGIPAESDEMQPTWFKMSEVPFHAMWVDDKHWLPLVLEGKQVKASFTFNEGGKVITAMDIKKF